MRLSGFDATFLYAETPSAHMHTLKVGVFQPPTSNTPYEDFVASLRRAVPLLPGFRARVAFVRWGLHHPVWVRDEDFDVCRHVDRVTARDPGDRAALDEVVATLAATPLRRDRPLWHMTWVDGLADGRIAVVARVHHALADGRASVEMLERITQDDPKARMPRIVPDFQPRASTDRLTRSSLREVPAAVRRIPSLLASTAQAAGRKIREPSPAAVKPFTGPRTAFNRNLEPGRSFATGALPLAPVLAIRRALGVTVTDIVLSVVGDAVARYLRATGQDTERALLATVPVGLPADSRRGVVGNHLSNILTSLCSTIEDPVARLRAVSAYFRAAKRTHDRLGATLLREWAEFIPGRPWNVALRTYNRLGLARLHRPPINLIVSSVKGPQSTRYAGGLALDEMYSVGPLVEGLGLNVTMWSYAGTLYVAALSLPDLPAPLSDLADAMGHALDDLVVACDLPDVVRQPALRRRRSRR